MTDKDAQVSFKTTAQLWKKKASERRENDAKRAGVAGSDEHNFESKRRSSNAKAKRVSSVSDDEQKDLRNSTTDSPKKKRITLTATRISDPNQNYEICFHEPVKVRFNSTSEGSPKDPKDPKK